VKIIAIQQKVLKYTIARKNVANLDEAA